ncbi:MAG: hypothetical protein WEA24_18035 [Gemmatimonadota bacterium]
MLALLLPGACGSLGGRDESALPGGADAAATDAPARLLVRGRIAPDTIVLEPLFMLDGAGAVATTGAARHRVRGFDSAGAIVFDETFEGTMVASGGEEHFQLTLPTGSATAARIQRVEVRAADGRTARRSSELTAGQFMDALERTDVVTATRTGEGAVQVRWAAGRFPAVIVRDAVSGQVLAFGRDGQTSVRTERDSLEVLVSDGVRSGSLSVRVR